MELTGRVKESFENFFVTHYDDLAEEIKLPFDHINDFYLLPNSMKWGVLVDFFESEGLKVNVFHFGDYEWEKDQYSFDVSLLESFQGDKKWIIKYEKDYSARKEAMAAAIKKANEILNKKLEE